MFNLNIEDMGIELYYCKDVVNRIDRNWKLGMKSFPGGEAAWIGFMYYMEKKYLPSLPSDSPLEESFPTYHSRLLTASYYPDDVLNPYLQQIWDLQLSPYITKEERITMLTMMDKCLFRMDDADEVLAAWEKVGKSIGGDTGAAFARLVKRCQQMIDIKDDIDAITVHWNSSVNFFANAGYELDGYFNCVIDADAIADSLNNVNYFEQTKREVASGNAEK